MEENNLKFKGEFFFRWENIYSVCMRGVRLWDKTKPLLIYTNGKGSLIDTAIAVEPDYCANIISQAQYRFKDLTETEWKDNYDEDARSDEGLRRAMYRVYGSEFDDREIVTILRFQIQ